MTEPATSLSGGTTGVAVAPAVASPSMLGFQYRPEFEGTFEPIKPDKAAEAAFEVDQQYRSRSLGTIDLSHKAYEKMGTAEFQKVWDGVTAHIEKIDAGSEDIKISLKTLIAQYQGTDGKIHYLDLSQVDGAQTKIDPDLLTLMLALQRSVKKYGKT